jgi:NAD(P)-dependent dehydrogenase (short-subunit alcohol dehydrogenase family)
MPRTVLITGCSSGLGHATARLFASKGWNVTATMPRLDITSDLVGLRNVLVTRLDVEDTASIRSAIASSIACFGGIDVLVNNARHGPSGVFETTIKIVEPGGVISTSFGQRSVAECIYAAATDGTDQLRYATDDLAGGIMP